MATLTWAEIQKLLPKKTVSKAKKVVDHPKVELDFLWYNDEITEKIYLTEMDENPNGYVSNDHALLLAQKNFTRTLITICERIEHPDMGHVLIPMVHRNDIATLKALMTKIDLRDLQTLLCAALICQGCEESADFLTKELERREKQEKKRLYLRSFTAETILQRAAQKDDLALCQRFLSLLPPKRKEGKSEILHFAFMLTRNKRMCCQDLLQHLTLEGQILLLRHNMFSRISESYVRVLIDTVATAHPEQTVDLVRLINDSCRSISKAVEYLHDLEIALGDQWEDSFPPEAGSLLLFEARGKVELVEWLLEACPEGVRTAHCEGETPLRDILRKDIEGLATDSIILKVLNDRGQLRDMIVADHKATVQNPTLFHLRPEERGFGTEILLYVLELFPDFLVQLRSDEGQPLLHYLAEKDHATLASVVQLLSHSKHTYMLTIRDAQGKNAFTVYENNRGRRAADSIISEALRPNATLAKRA